MLYVAWSVCLCVLVTQKYCAKTVEPIDMPFEGGAKSCGSKEPFKHVLDVGENRTNQFAAARGHKLAMRPSAKLLWRLVLYSCYVIAFLVYFCISAFVVLDSASSVPSQVIGWEERL